ncbi:Aste57867_14455 [Aphanomyces stellatus]|uniref:Aste57867_14455 protein n=1 Tax=Aphanomyces stellatus TaxID=120398 RepID=A0A485L119_9STRA|nr:hypothetical protein As57867_014401 [Aphanomyces stellatus]VFT91277.1 Aste57867_14455 [Aphanomyces stellatus]
MDGYVEEDEIIEYKAQLRLWRKEVRWCVQSLLDIGEPTTITVTARVADIAFAREGNTHLFTVTQVAPGKYPQGAIERQDVIVGVNSRRFLMEDLSLNDLKSLIRNLPRPLQLHMVRLPLKATNEALHTLKKIQKVYTALDERRHALSNQMVTYEFSVLELDTLKKTVDMQENYIKFLKSRVASMRRGVHIAKELKRVDKMKWWMEKTLSLQDQRRPHPIQPPPPSSTPRPRSIPSTPASTPRSVPSAVAPPPPRQPPIAHTRPVRIDLTPTPLPSIVPPSPKRSAMTKRSAVTRDMSWLMQFPHIDLKWLGKLQESRLSSVVGWYEDAFKQDNEPRMAKLLAEQVAKALLRHWIAKRNEGRSGGEDELKKGFFYHALQLKVNLSANAPLRAEIASERVAPEQLVTMNKDALAAPELMREREQIQQSAMRSVILPPGEANLLIKTRDGFKEVAVPGAQLPAAPEISLKSLDVEAARVIKPSEPAKPAAPFLRKVSNRALATEKPPAKLPPYVPLKRQHSHDSTTSNDDHGKPGSLKRNRSEDSTASSPVERPMSFSSNLYATQRLSSTDIVQDVKILQTRALVRALFNDMAALVTNVSDYARKGRGIVPQQEVSPQVFAGLDMININGQGTTMRISIGTFQVESQRGTSSALGAIKESATSVFHETVTALEETFHRVVVDYKRRRDNGASIANAVAQIAQGFRSEIASDVLARPNVYICTWRVCDVLVAKVEHENEETATEWGCQSFGDFLEALVPLVQEKLQAAASAAAAASVKYSKPLTSLDLPTISRGGGGGGARDPRLQGRQEPRPQNPGVRVACFKCRIAHVPGPCPPPPPRKSSVEPAAEVMSSRYSRSK